MADPVAALLDPRSVAVVGASTNPLKRGYQAIRTLLSDGFPGSIYPVNPRETEVLGLPAYPSVTSIDGSVDLALIVTPASAVAGLLRECGRKGVGAAVVIAVGFGETGEDGAALEAEIRGVAAGEGIGLIGPNTNGVFNLPARLNLVGASDVPQGRLALLCQSGNMALSLFTEVAHETSLGFSTYVGIGNEAGLRYHELLDYLRDDPDTGAVLTYAEGFRDGRALLRSAANLAGHKPIVCYKAGRSEAAQRSALSHTGAVAGSHAVAEAVLRQAGIVVVERSDELVPVAETLLQQPALPSPRVGVLTDGGGHGTVAADALAAHGLELPALTASTRERLAEVLPDAASTRNPVDVAGATDRDPRVFEPCLEALLDDPSIDGMLCVGLLGGYGIRFSDELAEAEEQAAARMAEMAANAGKPLVVQSAYAPAHPPAHDLLRGSGVPVHGSIETAARCVAALEERGRFRATAEMRSGFAHRSRGERTDRADRAGGERRALTEPEGRALLEAHGLPVGPWTLATDPDVAADAVTALGGPAALKIVSPDVVHKSDAGGVLLDVGNAEDAAAGFERVVGAVTAAQPDASVDGVLVTPMAPRGVELIVGVTTDPSFGPLLAVGAGGTAVEVLRDTAFRAVPVTPTECDEMLAELAVAPLLDGHRGAAPVDRAALRALLTGVSRLVAAEPGIAELDLNPVIAHPDGLAVVDVRVVVDTRIGLATPGRRVESIAMNPEHAGR
ncbi:hypothetical protein ER308_07520 [Egibacter rhizosphaerae]|uniref:CoA-binding domain-containing protein n=2 Tax=Egibacter rhizosphaerae TaxID=1670831 RepID=A0A411YL92_9ACTN|nr:hypothetical protein ER308_07520 [Egibacter rhizosphaerae]